MSSTSSAPRKPKPGAKRARHNRWRRISTWVTVVALVAFTIATVSFVGSLSDDDDAEVTRDLLGRIAAALQAQSKRDGVLPESLDTLQPADASVVIVREDAYGYLIRYERRDDGTFALRSVGPDGIAGTADDVVWK